MSWDFCLIYFEEEKKERIDSQKFKKTIKSVSLFSCLYVTGSERDAGLLAFCISSDIFLGNGHI